MLPSSIQEFPPLPLFDLEGHRGTRGSMPENTIPGMLKALELGVTTLEMDTHITQDKQVILAHDPYINPLFSYTPTGQEVPEEDAQKYTFYQMDYAHIKSFDVGSKLYSRFPEQQKIKTSVPLLAEVIDAVQNHLSIHHLPQVFYNIETKSTSATDHQLHPEPEVFIQLLLEVLLQKKITPWVILQSFDVRTLQVLHQKHPEIRTSLLVENPASLEDNLRLLGFTPTIYSPDYSLVTADLVQQCHQLQMKVIPWTVNTLEEMKRLKSLGVDGLITDYPSLFKHLP